MNEHALKDKVHDWLKLIVSEGAPIWFAKIGGGLYQRSGLPDYLLCVCGHFMAIELKSPDDGDDARPTPAQKRELEKIERAYGVATCLNSLIAVKRAVLGVLEDRGWSIDVETRDRWLGVKRRPREVTREVRGGHIMSDRKEILTEAEYDAAMKRINELLTTYPDEIPFRERRELVELSDMVERYEDRLYGPGGGLAGGGSTSGG